MKCLGGQKKQLRVKRPAPTICLRKGKLMMRAMASSTGRVWLTRGIKVFSLQVAGAVRRRLRVRLLRLRLRQHLTMYVYFLLYNMRLGSSFEAVAVTHATVVLETAVHGPSCCSCPSPQLQTATLSRATLGTSTGTTLTRTST